MKELRSAQAHVIGGVLSQVEMMKMRKYGYGAYYGDYGPRTGASRSPAFASIRLPELKNPFRGGGGEAEAKQPPSA